MSPLQQKPILHGRDHCPGGADPIPCMLTATGSYQEQVLAEPSLIGYWPLDDADEPALDYSGSDHHLSESTIDPTWGQTGPFEDDPAATSVLFNRSSGISVDCDNLYDSNSPADLYYFDGTDPFTFEILAYPTVLEPVDPGSGDGGGIMGVWDYPGGSTGGIYLVLTAEDGYVRMYRAGNFWDSPVALSVDEWVHLAMTYDGTTARLYFDGEEQLAEADTDTQSGSGFLRLGMFRVGSDYRANFKGRLAQAAIYNEALSASTIASHANTRIGGGAGGGGVEGPPGPPGADGADGADGAPGVGVPTGGTADQVLTKDSGTDYDTSWQDPASGGGVEVKDAGTPVGTRSAINLIEGTNVTLTIADDAGNDEVDVTIAASSGGAAVDVQEFTSSGTWTDPGGISVIEVICIGGGGQGAGGSSGVNSARSGGGGGGGAAVTRAVFRAADLAGTVAVTVGTGGTTGGGGGAAGAGTGGAAGQDGGVSSFGTHLKAGGGGGGVTNSAGGGGGAISSGVGAAAGTPAAAASAIGVGGQGTVGASGIQGLASDWGGATGGGGGSGVSGRGGGSSQYGGPGGGAGGGVSAGNVGSPGGAGGTSPSITAGTQGGGGAAGAPPTAGTPGAFTGPYSGTGGGGGGAGNAVAGANGGAGFRGSGGGGGGCGSNSISGSNAGGNGGNGGDGFVRVISY